MRVQRPGGELLSLKGDWGHVQRCPGGCIHVTVGNFTFRVSVEQFGTLVEMLSDAKRRLGEAPPSCAAGLSDRPH